MQEARAGWLEANPSKPLWSHEATISLGDLLTLARIFSIIPKVVSESELIEMTIVLLKETNQNHGRKRTNQGQEFNLNWEIFQHLCVKLAEKFAIQKCKLNFSTKLSTTSTFLILLLYAANKDRIFDVSQSAGLAALFELFSVMLENFENIYDPQNPREWVR